MMRVGWSKRRWRGFAWLLGFVMLAGLIVPWGRVAAGQLTARSLLIASAVPSAVTNHEFTFTYASATLVGSLVFQYCTTPLFQEPCAAPVGLDVSGTVLEGQGGETGFSLFSATANVITLSRIPAAVAQPSAQYVFSNVINPSSAQTFFVRISSYASTDGSGAFTDAGTVANSTVQTVNISTQVPPILDFCIGITITGDCSTAQGNFLQLGDLSSSQTASGTSQIWVGTNALNGYLIDVLGTTMTSGNNIIPALAVPTQSAAGNQQFGLNLRANHVPQVGNDPEGPGTAQPTAQYNSSDKFMYQSGSAVVEAGQSSDWQRFTASYIVNIMPSQAPGVYSTTLTYICSAAF